MKPTKTRIEGLPTPAKGQAFYFDWEGVPNGFGVRVTATGARSYILEKRIDGKNKRITLGRHGDITCEQAKIIAAKEVLLISQGTTSKQQKKRAKTSSVTLGEIAEQYILERRTKKGGALSERTKQDIRKHIEKSFSEWENAPIVKITRDKCSAKFTKLSEKSEAQANQAFRYLRALINFAQEAHRIDDAPLILENPVKVISGKKMWNPDNARNGRIPLEKVGAVWNMLTERRQSPGLLQIAQTGADLVIFMLLTGARWSEAAKLTWDRVNLEAGTWHLPDPKNHNPVTLPLPAPLAQILKERPRVEGNAYVFPGRSRDHVKDVRQTMEQVSKLAEIHLTPHDLRRSFRAIAGKCGIELWKTKLLMNHISADVTINNYTETSDLRYLAPESELIAAWVIEQGQKADGANVIQLHEVA